jgi:hypothetical protein
MNKKIFFLFAGFLGLVFFISSIWIVFQSVTKPKEIVLVQSSSSLSGKQLDLLVLKKIRKELGIDQTVVPDSIANVGDGVALPSQKELIKNNLIDAQIYKDARDGDYVVVFGDRFIIYRNKENFVVYDGLTPQQLLDNKQQELVDSVITKSKSLGIIPKDYSDKPAVSIVTDAEMVRKINSFYILVEKEDLVAQFSNPNSVVIYRPSTDTVINSGSFELTIK